MVEKSRRRQERASGRAGESRREEQKNRQKTGDERKRWRCSTYNLNLCRNIKNKKKYYLAQKYGNGKSLFLTVSLFTYNFHREKTVLGKLKKSNSSSNVLHSVRSSLTGRSAGPGFTVHPHLIWICAYTGIYAWAEAKHLYAATSYFKGRKESDTKYNLVK